jgi:hypothetical protein
VTTICEVLLRQREDKIREEYDTVLQQKLSGLKEKKLV